MITDSTKPILRMGGKLPLFYLPSTGQGKSGPAAVRSKYNLVLAFLPAGPQAAAYLQSIAANYPSIMRNDARVMSVLNSLVEETQSTAEALELPFLLLADENGSTTTRILGEGNNAGLIATDRFGIIYFAEACPTIEALPSPGIIDDWLEFIEIQCPECTDANASPWFED